MPTLCNNIISLGQLYEEGNRVVLDGEFMWVYEKGGKLLMKVQKYKTVFYKLVLNQEAVTCMLIKADEMTWLWHSRLGHVYFKAM